MESPDDDAVKKNPRRDDSIPVVRPAVDHDEAVADSTKKQCEETNNITTFFRKCKFFLSCRSAQNGSSLISYQTLWWLNAVTFFITFMINLLFQVATDTLFGGSMDSGPRPQSPSVAADMYPTMLTPAAIAFPPMIYFSNAIFLIWQKVRIVKSKNGSPQEVAKIQDLMENQIGIWFAVSNICNIGWVFCNTYVASVPLEQNLFVVRAVLFIPLLFSVGVLLL